MITFVANINKVKFKTMKKLLDTLMLALVAVLLWAVAEDDYCLVGS
jgi:hypothetical protein